jgi:hypothetical protein
MLQSLCLRLLFACVGLVGLVAPVSADPDARALADLLRMDEMIAVMQEEGVAFGLDLDRDMLDGQGGAYWADEVSRIYSQDRMVGAVQDALANSMDGPQRAKAAAFFGTALGQRILTLETSARVAMANVDVEEIARANFEMLDGSNDSRLQAITRFVTFNDLLERNVAGALSANYYFMVGLVEGGASKMGDEDIVAEVWSQEQETRDDTKGWLYGFLLMAYQPLSDADLQAYIDFSETPSGQALNAALFEGFDVGYRDISYDLGISVARFSGSRDL